MRAQRSARSAARACRVCDSCTHSAHAAAQRTLPAARTRVRPTLAAAHHPVHHTHQSTQPCHHPAPHPTPAQMRCTLSRVRARSSCSHTRPHTCTPHASSAHNTSCNRHTGTQHITHLHSMRWPSPWPSLAAAPSVCPLRLRVCRRKPPTAARCLPVRAQSAHPAAEQAFLVDFLTRWSLEFSW